MAHTNKKAVITEADLQGSDLFEFWSQKYGSGNVTLSLSVLTSYLDDQIGGSTEASGLVTQYSSPSATGFTVEVDAADTWLVMTPAAGYATGQITLPASDHGQEVVVNSTQAVTALTVAPQIGDSVVGAPTALAANDFFRVRYDEVLNRWYRVG